MKKILSIILAFVMMFSIANAQTVEHSRLFENTYVTLVGGGITTQHTGGQTFFWGGAQNIVNGIRPLAGLEIGKYVTPVVGFGIEGLAMFNTTGSNTFVDQSNVVGNLKFNLSNWFGGYKGEPRRVEVVFVPGLGWGHDYGNVYNDRNYLTYNIGAELNINLGKARAWQINVKPVVMWNNYNNVLTPRRANMQGRIQFGLTYKFGSRSKKSHNFVLCPYSVTAADYEAAQARIAELEAREPKTVEKVVEKVVEKQVIIEKVVSHDPALQTVITFNIGSTKLSSVERAKLGVLAKVVRADEKVYLVGSADSATGTEKRNTELANGRANTVKDILVKEYGISEDRIFIRTAFDTNSDAEASRAVVITLE